MMYAPVKPSSRNRLLPTLGMVALIALAGCSHAPQHPSASATTTGESPASFSTQDLMSAATDSQLEISYVRGHNHHRFTVIAKPDKVHAQSLIDHDLVKEGKLDPKGYTQVLEHLQSLLENAQRQPANTACRTPFAVHLKIKEQSYSASGCRPSEQSTLLSRIVQEAEFLLYSKN